MKPIDLNLQTLTDWSSMKLIDWHSLMRIGWSLPTLIGSRWVGLIDLNSFTLVD